MISKQEFADKLGVNCNYLFRKIHAELSLLIQLEQDGYEKRNRLLSERNINTICSYFGYSNPMKK